MYAFLVTYIYIEKKKSIYHYVKLKQNTIVMAVLSNYLSLTVFFPQYVPDPQHLDQRFQLTLYILLLLSIQKGCLSVTLYDNNVSIALISPGLKLTENHSSVVWTSAS